MKKISSLLLSLVIIFNMGISVFANNVYLSDIGNSKYKDSIKYLVSQGFINGYEDKTFRPNQFITVAEGLTIAERIFGNEENLPDKWEDWNNKGYADSYEIKKELFKGNYFEVMTYETAAEALLKMRDYKTFETALWFGHTYIGEPNRYFKNIIVMGYPYENESNYYLGITRGEFCEMVCFVMNYKDGTYIESKLDAGIELIPYKDTIIPNNELNDFKSELLKVPTNVKTAFNNDGGKIYVLDEKNWLELFPDEYNGVYDNKVIYLRIGQEIAVAHELGHYVVDKITRKGFVLQLNDELKANSDCAGLDISPRTMNDSNEFFAEAFRCYCNRSGIKLHCPALYEYIDKAVHLINS